MDTLRESAVSTTAVTGLPDRVRCASSAACLRGERRHLPTSAMSAGCGNEAVASQEEFNQHRP